MQENRTLERHPPNNRVTKESKPTSIATQLRLALLAEYSMKWDTWPTPTTSSGGYHEHCIAKTLVSFAEE